MLSYWVPCCNLFLCTFPFRSLLKNVCKSRMGLEKIFCYFSFLINQKSSRPSHVTCDVIPANEASQLYQRYRRNGCHFGPRPSPTLVRKWLPLRGCLTPSVCELRWYVACSVWCGFMLLCLSPTTYNLAAAINALLRTWRASGAADIWNFYIYRSKFIATGISRLDIMTKRCCAFRKVCIGVEQSDRFVRWLTSFCSLINLFSWKLMMLRQKKIVVGAWK